MLRFILRRFIQGIITLLVLGTLVFILGRGIGNPVDLLLPFDASMDQRAEMIKQLGLNRSLPVQYFEFIGGAVRGDLGNSIRLVRPVTEVFFERLPNSLKLSFAAFIIAVLLAIPLGVIAGANRGTVFDSVARLIAVVGIAAPSFWIGIVLMSLFAVRLDLLPAARMGGIDHYILPAFSLSFFVMAGMMRLLRSSMIEVLDSEFVKLARIKGVSRTVVIWKHCLRNTLIPVMTFAGMYLGILLAGAIVIETVFAWPGVGRLAYESILWRDYPLLQGVVMIKGAIIVAINLVVDIMYAYIDPRIRYG